jgi:hypothetical protein
VKTTIRGRLPLALGMRETCRRGQGSPHVSLACCAWHAQSGRLYEERSLRSKNNCADGHVAFTHTKMGPYTDTQTHSHMYVLYSPASTCCVQVQSNLASATTGHGQKLRCFFFLRKSCYYSLGMTCAGQKPKLTGHLSQRN